MKSADTSLRTTLATLGCNPDPQTGAITPPVHFSTTFERADDGSYPGGYVYSRADNPTRALFERSLAAVEGAEECAAFSSGMAAANALITALCAGGHLILPQDVYHGVRHLADTVWRPWGISVTAVVYAGAWEEEIRDDTRLVWIETPSNPLVRISDISRVSAAARARGIPTVVDSTWNTGVITRPLEFGADLVMHSTTKYLGGHSDVLGGAVLGSRGPLFDRIRHVQQVGGAVMDPFSAWLTLRGMRSLYPRIRMQCEAAQRLALTLQAHPGVDAVHYPGLPSHPGFEVARRQMALPGAMLSFEIPGGRQAAMGLTGRLSLFRRATSLGGTETLIEHRASIEPEPAVSPEGLLRVSVGLESPEELEADLLRALAGA